MVFAVAVVRHPFGGHYNTLFNPAMTAFAFVTICWTDLVTHYPAPFQQLPLTPTVDVPLNSSPAYRLMLGGANSMDVLDALLGNFNGPMGTTCIAVLLCCGLYLAVRRTIIWQIPAAALGVVGLAAWFFPRVNASHEISLLMELTSGVLLFAVIFVAAMDNGEIETAAGKWICGLILGGLVVLFRQLSKIELVAPFAIIIINTIDNRCDSYARCIGRGVMFCLKSVCHGVMLALKALLAERMQLPEDHGSLPELRGQARQGRERSPQMIRRFYQSHRNAIEKFDQFLLNNPVLERGLVIAPVIVTCNTLANALALSIAFAFITVLSILLTFFLPRKIPYTIRVIANAMVAALLFIPAAMLLERRFPESIFNLGIYLPLLVTNSLIVQKSESRYHQERFFVMLAQLITAALGFAAAACAVGALREVLGKGALLGQPMEGMEFTVPGVLLPFGGFLLVGFLSAGIQKLRNFLRKPIKKKEAARHE